MSRERPPRFSPDPLLRIVDGLSMRDAADVLGVNPGTITRWRNSTPDHPATIHFVKADEIAVRVGVHPAAIWGQEWWR
jgi:transcriptional regulator with XRE-family HTH domain